MRSRRGGSLGVIFDATFDNELWVAGKNRS
jgi:hypothetical protein